MSSNSYSQQDRQRFKLLHGGLTDEAIDADWQKFCEHIGWQQLSEPALPDDYEERMMARIFGAQGHDAGEHDAGAGDDNVVQLPSGARPSTVPARPSTARPSTAGPSKALTSAGAYRPEPLTALALQDMTELPASLGTSGVVTRPRRLPWLAAAVALVLGVAAATVLSHSGSGDPILAAPAPVPERATPGPDSIDPEHLSPTESEQLRTAPNQPQRDKPTKRLRIPTRKMVIVPPGGSSSPQQAPRADRADAVRVASLEGEQAAMPPASEHRYVGAEYGYARPSARVGAPTEPAAFEAPKLAPTVALSSAWPDHKHIDALPSAVPSAQRPSDQPDTDSHTPWQASSSWYGLGMTAPREDSGVPAGVRVTAQLDAIEAGRRLFGRL